ncbi:hypothetical protein SAMN05421852_102392 [Thermoflavimicrobium dichotomicum]|uniref:Uncharacterized protein n=1 Tax=Thermoflavimicrobium dichotomicum TaxID=46223 RepID=A0A1I3M0W8_9BACL|nr:hypothetical protein SAMN05421852_102392 [Thermoflavimicrobium dichotomicum]
MIELDCLPYENFWENLEEEKIYGYSQRPNKKEG